MSLQATHFLLAQGLTLLFSLHGVALRVSLMNYNKSWVINCKNLYCPWKYIGKKAGQRTVSTHSYYKLAVCGKMWDCRDARLWDLKLYVQMCNRGVYIGATLSAVFARWLVYCAAVTHHVNIKAEKWRTCGGFRSELSFSFRCDEKINKTDSRIKNWLRETSGKNCYAKDSGVDVGLHIGLFVQWN